MTQKMIAFGLLSLPEGTNPRRTFKKSGIKGLATSIKEDGVLQNLVVEPNGDGKYHVRTGKRRYLALKLLKQKGVIDDEYKVPVTVKKNLNEDDARRIATVENVQREALDPIDETEAFASLLQNGSTFDDVSAKTGVSVQTIRRRLALANLCPEAKGAVRKGELSLSIAEALTLGTETQQQFFIDAFREGAHLEANEVRETILAEKPSASMAIFPKDRYTGSYTSDLFDDESSTYFDDVEEFMRLQEEAVEEKAERYRKKHAFVEVLHANRAPWWQYRDAEEGEKGGVVLNLSPSGRFEMRKNLIKHPVQEEIVRETTDVSQPKEKAPYGPSLLRYIAHHKSMAVQAALLGNPRKLKEVALVLLLSSHHHANSVRIDVHSCIKAFDKGAHPKGYLVLQEKIRTLLLKLELLNPEEAETPLWPISSGHDKRMMYETVVKLSDVEIEECLAILPVLSFGQENIEQQEGPDSFFSQVSQDLNRSMREWWIPDEKFLSMLKRVQLEQVAVESGASLSLARLEKYKKSELVAALAAYFERTSNKTNELDEYDRKGTTWLPELMAVPSAEAEQAQE
jgi:ParB family transcriptional regulator, chromosome partitioning protein